MFEIYTSTPTDYTESEPFTFTTVRQADCTVLNNANNNFIIKRPGLYLITFTAVVSSATATEDFTVQLYRNGVAVPGVVSSVTSTAANDRGTVTLNTLVNVRKSCACIDNSTSLQIIVTSTAAGTGYTGDLTIVRIL